MKNLIQTTYIKLTNIVLNIATLVLIKLAGGSEVDFQSFVVSDTGECQLSETFFEMKKYLFL